MEINKSQSSNINYNPLPSNNTNIKQDNININNLNDVKKETLQQNNKKEDTDYLTKRETGNYLDFKA